MKTLAPASAKPRDIAFPRPLLPPVTSATRPLRLNRVSNMELSWRLANVCGYRLNVRAGFVPVNQPVPSAHKRRRINPPHAVADDSPVLQHHLEFLPLCITSFPLHAKPYALPCTPGQWPGPAGTMVPISSSVQIYSKRIMPDPTAEIKSSRQRYDWPQIRSFVLL